MLCYLGVFLFDDSVLLLVFRGGIREEVLAEFFCKLARGFTFRDRAAEGGVGMFNIIGAELSAGGSPHPVGFLLGSGVLGDVGECLVGVFTHLGGGVAVSVGVDTL